MSIWLVFLIVAVVLFIIAVWVSSTSDVSVGSQIFAAFFFVLAVWLVFWLGACYQAGRMFPEIPFLN